MIDLPATPGTTSSPALDGTIPTVRIGGLPIAALDLEEAVRLVLDAPARGRRLRMHFCTAHTIVESTDDPQLRDALVSGGILVPDGVPLVWLGRARGFHIGRVCGLDLLPAVADRGREIGARHYFYGGAEGMPERLAQELSRRYPGLIVAGTESPPFRPLTPDEDAAMVQRLNDARPDFVWVGLGTPKQDMWLAANRHRLTAPVLLAVGAAFEIVSGIRARAPLAIQRAGLEWAFRLALEPRRLARRYSVVNARFFRLAAADLARRTPRLRRED